MHREQRLCFFFVFCFFFSPAKETKGSSSVLCVFSCGCAVSRVVVDHTVLFFPWRGQSTGTAGLKEKMLVFWARLCLLILSPPSWGFFFLYFFFWWIFSNQLLGSVIACRTQVGSNDATRQTCFFFSRQSPASQIWGINTTFAQDIHTATCSLCLTFRQISFSFFFFSFCNWMKVLTTGKS